MSGETGGLAGGGSRPASFYRYAEVLAEQPAVIEVGGGTVTYGEMAGRVNRASHALRAAGLAAGERVAVLMGNSARFLEIALAAGQIGVQLVPVNTQLTPEEVAYILANSDSRLLFADAERLGRAEAARRSLGRDPAGLVAVDAVDAPAPPGHGSTTRWSWGSRTPSRPIGCTPTSCCTRRARPGVPRVSCGRCRRR
ncbi:hypothetical protein FRACA_3610003 [Frankia canadensis]|uniref:AMP-dependent synthetase/ligase domain-containing protein n=1 Tax=Frankia canadensis TaxID=1836972 RepID=A0A2I2KVK3_9ACTN|nr:AMP-binding protein [Frankia canadensis]SNQ49690.1 hypothetical protein FRACA_3610003 [Frankia canadensis]SOU56980.1 hypothetical protein FRACA_3610003 [Frankia canadensis]